MTETDRPGNPRNYADRIQVCVYPTERGESVQPCGRTIDDLERHGCDISCGPLIAFQEHVRDAHLFPGGNWRDPDLDAAWRHQLRDGSSYPVGGVLKVERGEPMYGAYVFVLANGTVWMFAGTRGQADLWIAEHKNQPVAIRPRPRPRPVPATPE